LQYVFAGLFSADFVSDDCPFAVIPEIRDRIMISLSLIDLI
jgi:hypothetical protein